jgi:virulence factor Mce-like protein
MSMAIAPPKPPTQTRPELTWKQRLEIVPGQHRPKRIRNGAMFVAAVLIFLWIIYTKPTLPFLGPGGSKLTAELSYGANIRPGYTPVRVHGVEVGQVTGVERAPSGRGVRIEMRIEDGKGVVLHRDAGLSLRWRTLLGRNMYIDLDPGSPSAPRLGNAFIPRSRTSDQVELDTALEPFDARGRKSARTIIAGFDGGFSDPKALQRTVDAVAPTMAPLSRTLQAFRGTSPGTDLPSLVRTTSVTMDALARSEAALAGVIDHGQVALGATAARSADLSAILNTAPAALSETRATMSRLNGTLDAVDPLATALIGGASRLDGAAARTQVALRAAVPLLADLRPTLRDLRPALADLSQAAADGTPAFGPLTSTLERVRDTFLPFLHANSDESKRPNYQDIGPAVASVSSATSWGDKNGPVANFEAAAGENAIVDSPCDTAISNPSAQQLIQCELLSRAYAASVTGRRPQDVRVRDSAVPFSKLAPYLTGKAALKPNPHLKPLHVLRRSK